MNSIGKNIRELRKEEKMTQGQLAKKLNVTQDTISLWELNKREPSVSNIIMLADLFGISTDSLLGRD